MSFWGNMLKAAVGMLSHAANPGTNGLAGARPPATAPVQEAPPAAGPVNAGKRIDKRTMAMSPLPADWAPGMPPPPGWGARPDEYPHDVGGAADGGPVTRHVGLPEGMQDPDAMGSAPWGNRQMSDQAILAWYQNQHARAMGGMATMPAFDAHGATQPAGGAHGPTAAAVNPYGATQGVNPYAATQGVNPYAATQGVNPFGATHVDPFGATGRMPMAR